MVDRIKLINYIKSEINPYGRPFEGTVFEFGCKLIEYIENMDEADEWVPCDENPEEDGCYIVAWLPIIKDENGNTRKGYCPYEHFYGIAEYDEDEWVFNPPSGHKDYILLSWQPLPDPYRE